MKSETLQLKNAIYKQGPIRGTWKMPEQILVEIIQKSTYLCLNMVLENESKTERSFQMDLEVIRKTLNERPFRPIVFHLDNGEKQVVKHPEILVSEINVITLDDDGLPVFIKPEAITAIHYARNAAPPRAPRRRKRTTSRQ